MPIVADKSALAYGVAAKYQLQVRHIHEPLTGYRNYSFKTELTDGRVINIMLYKAEPGIQARINRADLVSSFLATQGLPVRVRIDPRILTVAVPNQEDPNYAAIYNYLSGTTIAWESYSMDHLKALGLALAKMHQSLQTRTAKATNTVIASETSIYVELLKLLDQIETYFANSEVAEAINRKLNLVLSIGYDRLRKSVKASRSLRLQHILHMDFVRSNVLFSDDTLDRHISYRKANISGIIDFEKVSYGSPLFDLARTLAFLLVDCKYKQPNQVKKYFLYSGYLKHGQSASLESTMLLSVYTDLFLLHDFYKFLKHNPYESLAENEHYIRTRDILQASGMIKYKG